MKKSSHEERKSSDLKGSFVLMFSSGRLYDLESRYEPCEGREQAVKIGVCGPKFKGEMRCC